MAQYIIFPDSFWLPYVHHDQVAQSILHCPINILRLCPGCRAPELQQVGLGTKILLQYYALVRPLVKSMAQQPSGASAIELSLESTRNHAGKVAGILQSLRAYAPVLHAGISSCLSKPQGVALLGDRLKPGCTFRSVWQDISVPWEPGVTVDGAAVTYSALQSLGFHAHQAAALLGHLARDTARAITELRQATAAAVPQRPGSKKAVAKATSSQPSVPASSQLLQPEVADNMQAMMERGVKAAAAKLWLPEVSLPVDAVRFQLEFMSHLLERPAPGEPDGRVSFTPDAWQKRLLDVIDQGEWVRSEQHLHSHAVRRQSRGMCRSFPLCYYLNACM